MRNRHILRILAGVLSVLMLFGACGCGTKSEKTSRKSNKKTAGQKAKKDDDKDGENDGKKSGGDFSGEPDFYDLELSDTYLVGFDYSSYELMSNDPVIIAKVRYDKKIEAELEYRISTGGVRTETMLFDLTDEQYENIRKGIDLRELYELDPEELDPDNVCDGGTSWLLIYDKEDNLAKRCGGFCPQNKSFGAMRRVIFENLPEDFKEAYDFSCKSEDAYCHFGFGEYGVFLSEEHDISKLQGYRTVVIDAQNYTAEEIAEIKRSAYDIYVFSYINIGSIEDFRPYYSEFSDLTLGDYENWPEEKWVDVTSERWQSFILEELAPSLLEKGIDGFFVDNCDVYYQYPTEEMLDGVAAIMKGLVAMQGQVIINGGDTFLDAYTENGGNWYDVITGINQETVYSTINFDTGDFGFRKSDDEEFLYFTEYIEKYADMGAYIYLLEYTTNNAIRERIEKYCSEHRFMYYISDSIELDG